MLSSIFANGVSAAPRNDVRANYPALNGLRFLAALGIVGFHYFPQSGHPRLHEILQSAPAALSFFFLLSGFVLAHRYPEVSNKRSFWRARFIRIYPMYLLAFLLFAPFALQKYHHDPKSLLMSFGLNVTMLQSWTPYAQSWNGPSWALSVEAFLYAVFPFLVKPISRVNRIGVWAIVAMVPAAITVASCFGLIPDYAWRMWIRNNPLFWVAAFSFGISLGLWKNRKFEPKQNVDLLMICVTTSIMACVLFWPATYREVLINGGAIILFAVLVILCTFPSAFLGPILGAPLLDRLGKASFVLYIIQAPMWHYFQAANNLLHHRSITFAGVETTDFLLFLCFLVVVSVLLESYVDRPITRWLQKRGRGTAGHWSPLHRGEQGG